MSETFRLSEEVTRMLADTVVEKEVIEPMNKIGWSEAATPPPPDYSGQPPGPEGAPAPAPAPVATTTPAGTTLAPVSPLAPQAGEQKTTPTSVLDLEQFKDPTTGKYFGKYDSQEQALKGVGHVVQMAKSAFTRNGELEAELTKLRAVGSAPSVQPVATPAAVQSTTQEIPPASVVLPKSPKLAKVLSDLVENGGVLDAENMQALMDGISDQSRVVAEHTAERVVETRDSAASKDKAEWDKVDEHMRANYPNALNFADEMGLMVQSNPLLAAGVAAKIAQGDRVGAAVEVWKLFSSSQGLQNAVEARKAAETEEIRLAAADAVRREATEQARRDAGVHGSSATGIHETPGGIGPSPEQVAQAGAEMMSSGLGQRWREMTIGRLLTDPLFNRP